MILHLLDTKELTRLVAASKRVFEDAFADGMAYEEVNLRYRELKMLQEELNRRLHQQQAKSTNG